MKRLKLTLSDEAPSDPKEGIQSLLHERGPETRPFVFGPRLGEPTLGRQEVSLTKRELGFFETAEVAQPGPDPREGKILPSWAEATGSWGFTGGSPRRPVVHGPCCQGAEPCAREPRHSATGAKLSYTLPLGHTNPRSEAAMSRIQFDQYVKDGAQNPEKTRGTAQLAPPTQDDVEDAVRKLPPLPALLQQLMSELRNPETDIKNLEEGIASDPGLTTRVLKMANSPFYMRATEVVDVQRAIMTLGFRTVSNLVLAAGLRRSMTVTGRVPTFTRNGLFRHSLASAICCARLGQGISSLGPHRDQLFVAGLLHDVGRVALARFYIERSEAIDAIGDPTITTQSEFQLLGIDHMEAGRRVLACWGLPAELESPITRHHDDPQKLGDDLVTVAVIAADEYLNRAGFARENPTPEEGRLESAARILGVEITEIEALLESFEDEVSGILGAFA